MKLAKIQRVPIDSFSHLSQKKEPSQHLVCGGIDDAVQWVAEAAPVRRQTDSDCVSTAEGVTAVAAARAHAVVGAAVAAFGQNCDARESREPQQ